MWEYFAGCVLLPEIAKVYGVTVDDLYRADVKGYPNYAQRLLAVYEASGRSEDFLAAEKEFSGMSGEELTPDDICSWGILYHYMMKNSARMALQKLDQAMQHTNVTEQVRICAAQQRIRLLCDQGKGHEEAARYEQKLAENPSDCQLWLLCTISYEFAGEKERALDFAMRGMERFGGNASLYLHAGDICKSLKRYEEAYVYWRKALELDSTYLDAAYSMGFCYEEQGQFRQAHTVWTELVRELDRRGLTVAREYPAQMAAKCLKLMK